MTDFQTESMLDCPDSLDTLDTLDISHDLHEASDAITSPAISMTPTATHANPIAKLQDPQNLEDLQDQPVPVRSITNSPRCAPASVAKSTRPRQARTVRVDAWAVPASANWSRVRTTTTVRKVRRGTPSTDWALPF